MIRRGESEPLLSEMFTVYIESNLSSPLSGEVALNINPKDSVRDLLQNFLIVLENDDCVPGLAVYDKHYNILDWNSTVESQGVREGSKLFIGLNKKIFLKRIHLLFIGIATISIAFVALITSIFIFTSSGGSVSTDYGIVIDAGSTHTQVFLYYWPGNKYHGTGFVYQKETCEYEVGIASGFDPKEIITCVNKVTDLVPTEAKVRGLYLGATGGMRLLNLTNPKESDLILMAFKYALQTTSAPVKSVEILKGQDEATYSWITTNFLENILDTETINYTFGSLDLGGASTQYAYAVPQTYNDSAAITSLNLYGHKHRIISKSYLCFGYYEAMKRCQAIMMVKLRSAIINDPCLPLGFNHTFQLRDFAQESCVTSSQFDAWLKNDSTISEFTVVGASNYSMCKSIVSHILDESTCQSYSYDDCMPQTDLADLDIKFMAVSGFYYVADFFNATLELDNLITGAQSICALSWEQMQEKYSKFPMEHVIRYCFASIYIAELLTSNYGFNASTWKNILFTLKIKESDVGWSLGFMINATNSLPIEAASPPAISLTILILLLIISLLMIFAAIVTIRHYFSRKQRFCLRKLPII